MKKHNVFFCLLAVISASLVMSCRKSIDVADPADAFVGNYGFTQSTVIYWGAGTGSVPGTGNFSLSKVSVDRVRMTGNWKTEGLVKGNAVQFDNCTQSGQEGYLTYIFDEAQLIGNQLFFRYKAEGQIKYNGIPYPWESFTTITADKK